MSRAECGGRVRSSALSGVCCCHLHRRDDPRQRARTSTWCAKHGEARCAQGQGRTRSSPPWEAAVGSPPLRMRPELCALGCYWTPHTHTPVAHLNPPLMR